jgi:hypothetical protein
MTSGAQYRASEIEPASSATGIRNSISPPIFGAHQTSDIPKPASHRVKQET